MYKELTIKTELSELTIEDFYKVSKISMDNKLSDIEKNIEMVTLLGGQDIEDMPIEIFSDIMKSINFNFSPDDKIKDIIELDGITLKLKGNADNFNFTVKQMMNIKKHMAADNLKYIHHMIKEVYNVQTSIKGVDSFLKRNITMDIVSPFIQLLSKKYK